MSSPQFVHPKSEEDPVLSPIFLSSADDVTSSSSSSNSSSHESGSPRNDWIMPSNIPVNIANPPPLWSAPGHMNFSMTYSSPDQWRAMDFEPDIPSFLSDASHHFSIDPNALHFGDQVYGRGCETNGSEQEALIAPCDPALQFSYQFSSPMPSEIGLDVPLVHQMPTPMSASAVSSLSRSPSPLSTSTYSQTPLQDTGINPNELTLISQRAREAAGVTLAIPISANADTKMTTATAATTPFQLLDGQILTPQHTPSMSPSETNAAHTATSPKVAIPRLRPPQTEPLAPSLDVNVYQNDVAGQDVQSLSSQPSHLTKTGRPKTSHTTIERRYRTNLNARILALRRAVPALRILEKSIPDGGVTQGKGLTGASAPKSEFNDIVNERGYVDGVKAAKKNSKGVVLGKAVEYIKALKRREIRLRRETDGLKALLMGLVGGPELLVVWEKEWRAKFGGEEMDEIEEDADTDGDGDDGGEGDEDEDDDGNDEDADTGRKGRPKKRGKVDTTIPNVKSGDKKSPSATSVPAPQAGEKRKRGRPRKIQTPPTNVEVPKLVLHPPNISPVGMQQQQQPIQTEPPKFLLAAFVLFNFFSNSPFSPTRSSAPLNTHEGTVLSHHTVSPPTHTSVSNWPWLSFQIINSVVSILLLVYLLSDGGVREKLSAPLRMIGLKTRKQPQTTKEEEPRQLPRMGILGLLKAAVTRCVNTSRNDGDLKQWRLIAEAMVLDSFPPPSLISAVQTYLSFSSVVASRTASFSDRITLALLSHTFSLSTAQKRWTSLQAAVDGAKTVVSAPERLALSLDLGEAVQIIGRTRTACIPDDTPVKRLARFLVLKSTKKLAAEEWLNCVGSGDLDDLDLQLSDTLPPALVLEAGKQLGGKVGELVAMLERCHGSSPWCESERELEAFEENDEQESRSSASSSEDLSTILCGEESQSEEIEHTRSMLLATVLYKQIFSQEEEHTSPSPTNLSNILALRRTLASAAFDCCPETEDARDRVVDILAEMSRASKRSTR